MFQPIDYQSFWSLKHTTSMFHFYFQCFILKTLREKYKNTVGAIQNLCGSDNALPQCFEKWNMKLKMKHKSRMFQLSKVLIINRLKHKNETWKINQKFWKCMDIMWDKLQFKSWESLTEFCDFAHCFEFWVLFFVTSKLLMFRVRTCDFVCTAARNE